MKVSHAAALVGLPATATEEQVFVRLRALRARQQKVRAAAAARRVPSMPEPQQPEFARINGNLPDPKPLTEAEAWSEISAFMTGGRGPTAGTG